MIVNVKRVVFLKDGYGFQMLSNALNLIYRKINSTQIIFIEDICNIMKGALEVFSSVCQIALKNNHIFNKRTSDFARMIFIANRTGDEAYETKPQ